MDSGLAASRQSGMTDKHAPPREFIFGPWRAVSVLGVTEILSWGTLFYPPVLTVPLIAADHGWSRAFTMGGFSLGLLVGGLCSRYVGAQHRPLRRPCGDADRLAGRRRRLDRPRRCRQCRRLFCGLGCARRRHGGVALRSGLRHARPHFRSRRAGADHHADACRRLCLDRELAGDAIPHRGRRLARLLSRLCRLARLRRRAAACLRAAAPSTPRARHALRRRHLPSASRRRSCCRRTGLSSCWSHPALPPMPSCRRRSRRNCSPFSKGSVWRRMSSSPSACYSARRRF